MSHQAIVIGYSGHAYVLIDILLANGFSIIGYCNKESKNSNPYNLKYLGDENNSEILSLLRTCKVFVGIGDIKIRAKRFEYLVANGIDCPPVVHPLALISPQVDIGIGTVVMPGAIINSGAKIGKSVICNSGSIVEHDCCIGSFSHIAPGAVLAGNVSVGERTFVGANSVIIQGKNIGHNVIIGAGSVVISDVPDNSLSYGNPAKIRL